MKKFVIGMFAALSLSVVGCAGSDTGTGSSSSNCSTDADCGSGEACNTIGHVCLTICTGATDCPDSAKNCLTVPGGTAKVCQCSTDQLCGGGTAFCNTTDAKCEVKCSDNSGCQEYSPARTCDTATGYCVAGSAHNCGTVDCTTAQYCDANNVCQTKCTTDASCGAGGVCDTSSGICGTNSNACVGDNIQSTCNYGFVCSGSICNDAGTCSNVSPAPTVTAGHSPVIFNVARTGSTRQDPTNCVDPSGNALTVVQFGGDFYDPDGDATNTSTYSHAKWVSASGALNPTFDNTVTIDPATGHFTLELCAPSSNIQAGLIIIDQAGHNSNVACLP